MDIHVEVDQTSLLKLTSALDAESDGKTLMRELAVDLSRAMESAASLARSNVLGLASAGLTRGASLRTAIAAGVDTKVRLGGDHVVVAVKVSKDGMPRGFRNAPKRLNSRKGWRHQVYGTDTWVSQRALPPEWFDRAMRLRQPTARRAAERAVNRMAERISART